MAYRVSLEDANVAGIMVLDKQLGSVPLGGEPRTDTIEGMVVTDKAILIYGTGKRDRQNRERPHVVGDGQFDFLCWGIAPPSQRGVLDSEVCFCLRGPLQACPGTPSIGSEGG